MTELAPVKRLRIGDGTRLAVGRAIGQGGMGTVFDGYDRQHKRRVALKVYDARDHVTAARVRAIFERLNGWSHPNVVQLYELIEQPDELILVMELVEGTDFLLYCGGTSTMQEHDGGERKALQCDETRLRAALPQLAAGVAALHQRDVVHRDLKPENVQITPDGRLVILDFSLSVGVIEPVQREGTEGTVVYMAPEQADSATTLTAASDWYSVGVMLYEAMVGRPPHSGPAMAVLRDKATVPAPPVEADICDAPADLAELCADLLAIFPEERPDDDDVLRRLGLMSQGGDPGGGADAALGRAAFVGRGRWLAELARLVDTSCRRHAGIAFVGGERGIGKTALVDAFVQRMGEHHRDAIVLRGRCRAKRPTVRSPVDDIAGELAAVWSAMAVAEQRAILPHDVTYMRAMFPLLARVAAVADARDVSRYTELHACRTNALAALRETMGLLARRRPVVMVIDDVQLAAPEELDILADLLRPPDPPPFLLVLAGRDLTSDVDQLIHATGADALLVSLEELTASEVVELVRPRCSDGAKAQSIADVAGGNPGLALSMCAVGAAISGEDPIAARLSELPRPATQLLRLLAVLDVPVALDRAFEAAGVTAMEVADARAALELCSAADESAVEILEDARVAVLGSLRDSERRDIAVRAAERLSSLLEPAAVARLYIEARELAPARSALVKSARHAERTLRYRRGAALLDLYFALTPDDEARVDTMELYAQLLAAAGRTADAAAVYAKLAGRVGAARAVELEVHAARHLVLSGEPGEALRAFRAVLERIGLPLAPTPGRALLQLLRRRAWLRLRGLGYREASPDNISAEQRARADAGWTAGYFIGLIDPVQGANLQSRNLALALKVGDPERVGRAAVTESLLVATQAAAKQARRLVQVAETIAERHGHEYLRAYAGLGRAAIAYFAHNDWRATSEELELTVDIFRTRPELSVFELDVAQTYECFALYHMGQLVELSRRVFTYLREADRRGDAYGGFVYRTRLNVVWLLRDDVFGAERALDEAEELWALGLSGFQVQHWYLLFGRCEHALYLDDLDVVEELLAGAMPRMDASFLPRVRVVRAEYLCLRARAALATAVARASQCTAKLREARQLARQLRKRSTPLNFPLASVVDGCAAALVSNVEAARSHLESAIEQFEALEMRLWAAAAKYRLGRVLGGDAGETLIAAAESWARQQGIAHPARVFGVYAPGRSRRRSRRVEESEVETRSGIFNRDIHSDVF